MIKYMLFMTCLWTMLVYVGSVNAADKSAQPSTAPSNPATGDKKPKDARVTFENSLIKMFVIPRTREQMKAFYEGRGFSKAAIDAIGEVCFMTVVIRNKTGDVLWLDLGEWEFGSPATDIKRLDRVFWRQRWESLSVPMANRSTFGWTLLPERRDLRAEEGVGGNITLRFSEQPFTITANFPRGMDKQQKPLSVQLQELQCTQ